MIRLHASCPVLFAMALFAGAVAAQEEVLEGVLRVERQFDAIELSLDRVRLDVRDPLPLASLDGRDVELLVERQGRKLARVISVIAPRPWQGSGDAYRAANGELQLSASQGDLRLAGLPAGAAQLLEGRRLEAQGWIYPETRELVFTTLLATVLQPSYVNERSVDAQGRPTYEARRELRVGDRVRVFDLNAYGKARRDAEGQVVEEGTWRANLAASLPGDVLMARVAVLEREASGSSGWLPLSRLSLGATAHASAGLTHSLGAPDLREQRTAPPEQRTAPDLREQRTAPIDLPLGR
ncbi:MAG: hypothetical protein R3F62_11010 [Planctomycetota bacterium]